MSFIHEATGPMTRREHIGIGIAYGYPLCCVLRWALGLKIGRPQAVERGVRWMEDGRGPYVPCGVFHRGWD